MYVNKCDLLGQFDEPACGAAISTGREARPWLKLLLLHGCLNHAGSIPANGFVNGLSGNRVHHSINRFMLIDYHHSNGHNMGGLNFQFSDTEVGKYRTPRLLGQAHHGKHMPNMERAHVDPGWKQLPILEFLVLPYFDSNPKCTYRSEFKDFGNTVLVSRITLQLVTDNIHQVTRYRWQSQSRCPSAM
jgi:hypothetical protein